MSLPRVRISRRPKAEDGGTGEEGDVEVDALAEGEGDEESVEGGEAEGEAGVLGDDEDDGDEECGAEGEDVGGAVDGDALGGGEGDEEEAGDGQGAADRHGGGDAGKVEGGGAGDDEGDEDEAEGVEPGSPGVAEGDFVFEVLLGLEEGLVGDGGDFLAAAHDDGAAGDAGAFGDEVVKALLGELGGKFKVVFVDGLGEAHDGVGGEVDDGIGEEAGLGDEFADLLAGVGFETLGAADRRLSMGTMGRSHLTSRVLVEARRTTFLSVGMGY